MSNFTRLADRAQVPGAARHFTRLMLGFGVTIGVALAPLLGRLDVPLFTPLLSLIPADLQNRLIALSTALASIIAVAVQFYATSRLSQRRLESLFRRILAWGLASLLLLIIVNTFFVVHVQMFGGQKYESLLRGVVRRNIPPCTPEMSDESCLAATTMKHALWIEQWGDGQIKIAELLMTVSYLCFWAHFGALVGLVTVRRVLQAAGGGKSGPEA